MDATTGMIVIGLFTVYTIVAIIVIKNRKTLAGDLASLFCFGAGSIALYLFSPYIAAGLTAIVVVSATVGVVCLLFG